MCPSRNSRNFGKDGKFAIWTLTVELIAYRAGSFRESTEILDPENYEPPSLRRRWGPPRQSQIHLDLRGTCGFMGDDDSIWEFSREHINFTGEPTFYVFSSGLKIRTDKKSVHQKKWGAPSETPLDFVDSNDIGFFPPTVTKFPYRCPTL